MKQDSATVISRYRDAWGDSIRSLLASGPESTAEITLLDADSIGLPESNAELCWLQLEVSGAASGRQAVAISRASITDLAQLIGASRAEPHTDDDPAIENPLQLLAQQAGNRISQKTGLDLTFTAGVPAAPDWECPDSFAWRIESGSAGPITLLLRMNDALATALKADAPPMDKAAPPDITVNMLRDVGIPATIRLGEAALAVSDVLSFGAGRALGVDAPYGKIAELAVGEQVMARGEVVLVDGNYGLRITELAGTEARIAILRAGDLAE